MFVRKNRKPEIRTRFLDSSQISPRLLDRRAAHGAYCRTQAARARAHGHPGVVLADLSDVVRGP